MMIRAEAPSDIGCIENITKAAFANAEHSDHNEHLIISLLRNTKALTISMVAEQDHEILGHVAVSPVTFSDYSNGWYGLGPVAVHPDHQQQGIGTQLINAAIKSLRDMDANGCVVLGDPKYYSKFGFTGQHALDFPGVPAEYFQSITFKGSHPSGTVAYHPAFYA